MPTATSAGAAVTCTTCELPLAEVPWVVPNVLTRGCLLYTRCL
jgi:hypothetical protein